MAIPKAPVKRIIKEEGAERVSADAVDALVEFLEAEAEEVSEKAIVYAKYAKRKTVKGDDIALATGHSKTCESPAGQKHNLLDVIKDVFDAAAEGKGIEEIIKGFMKFEKKNE